MLNTFVICLATFTLIILYQIYRFILKPKAQLEFYKSQGLSVSFTPFSGFLKQCALDIAKNKDMFYSWKQLNSKDPKPRAFASNLGQYPVVALKDPELIKQYYINQEKYYIKAPAAIDFTKTILRNGTLFAEGEVWKQHRKLSNVLYNYDAVKERIPEITQIIDDRLEKLKEKDLNQINFLTEVQHILLEVAGKIFLDLEISKLQFKGQTVSAFVAELIDRTASQSSETLTLLSGTKIAKMGIFPGHKALVKDIEDLRAFLLGAAKAKLEEILANKDKSPSGKNPLLLQLIYEQMVKMNDSTLTAVDLVDEFVSFVVGTMDTTSHATIYTSYFVLQNSVAQKKVLEEAQKTFQDNSKVTIDALHQMDYTSAILKESLRLAPPLPNFLPRFAVEDNTLGDLKIKAGTVVVIGGVTNSFDPEYHDEPEKFVPERWLDENSRTRKSVSKNAYVYIPFSTGARTCPGQHLGNALVKILIGQFVKKFNFEHSDKNYEMVFGAKFFNEPHNPLIYTLRPRK